jgi:hypothetical protein
MTRVRSVIALLAVLLVSSDASAHRLDEYLQAARIDVESGRVELDLNLTAGAAVADAIIADIDRDGDGSLSSHERQSYAARVVSAIQLEVDEHPIAARLVAASFPEVEPMRRGEGTIRIRADTILPPLAAGAHRLYFRNAHRNDISVYLANALVPKSERITIAAQRRDGDQRELTIEYVIRPEPFLSLPHWLLGSVISLAAATSLLIRRSLVA